MSLTRRRTATDVTMALTLTSDGVRIDFADLSNITVMIYSDRYRVAAGRCSYEIAGTTLLVKSPADNQRYLGDHRVVLTCTYGTSKATYDAPAFEVVATSAEVDQQGQTSAQETGAIGIDLHVEDISSSLVQEVIAAAINATTEALEAAEEARNAQGPQGEQGPVGPAGPSYDDTEVKEKLTELSEGKEDKANKVTALSDESTDTQYPSAKCVHDSLSSLAEEIASNGVLIEDLQNMKIDKENDDYYPKMAVGLADNLAGVDVVDSEINFRRSGGGAISDGVARIESIKGNSVVWNQLMGFDSLKGDTAWDVSVSNGIFTLTSKVEYPAQNKSFRLPINSIVGHTYLVSIDASNSMGFTMGLQINSSYPNITNYSFLTASKEGKMEFFPFGTKANAVTIGATFTAKSLLWVDLTQMFGSGNEPTTIEEFYARIPMGVDLNAYNEGEVIHMDVQSIESQGVNAWDEEWEAGRFNTTDGSNVAASSTMRMKNAITVLPNATYYCKATVDTWVLFLDKNGKVIEGHSTGLSKYENACNVKNTSFLTPSNAAYIRAYFNQYFANTTTYNHDICINLSDASINDKYFPYIKRVEDLAVIRKYFPQGMKSAGSAHDEIRYNKASGKWEKVVRIGEVDMGSLKWDYATVTSIFYATGSYFFADQSLLSVKYANKKGANEDKNSYAVGGSVRILDSAYTDAAALKASLQGVMLYYELAEPIVTELDEEDQLRDLDYQVWNAGTEKAIAEGKSAPLAADISYGFNAIGKIKELEEAIKALQTQVASL